MDKKTYSFDIDGYQGIVIIPDNFNGHWLWKTEFFYAFDALEQSLFNQGFARVSLSISDKYGSPDSIKVMRKFYERITTELPLDGKCILIGFSRGGLYAFNFATSHPECVDKVYLDAPVLDLRTWPRRSKKYQEYDLYLQVIKEYHFSDYSEYKSYKKYPVHMFKEYFSLKIPTLLVAGEGDTIVPFEKNSSKMIQYAEKNDIDNFYYFIKKGDVFSGGDHHPHSFGNVGMKLIYGCDAPEYFDVYSNTFENVQKIKSETKVLEWFFNK